MLSSLLILNHTFKGSFSFASIQRNVTVKRFLPLQLRAHHGHPCSFAISIAYCGLDFYPYTRRARARAVCFGEHQSEPTTR